MPKHTDTKKLITQASKHDSPITKSVRFTFQGEPKVARISQHNGPEAIRAAFASAAGTKDTIEIVGEGGIKLRLGYPHLKDNGKAVVRTVQHRTQGAPSRGAAATNIMNSLSQIMRHWGLENTEQIFGDQKFAPKEPCFDGRVPTIFDFAPVKHPVAWSTDFASALYQLSKVTTGKHAEALRAMIGEAEERHSTIGHPQQTVMEIMTQDVKAVVDKVRTEHMLEALLEGETVDLPMRPK